jgi:uncharacterized Zn finger protein
MAKQKKKKKKAPKTNPRKPKNIKYQCKDCGKVEQIPRGIVEMIDIMDGDGDLTDPPTFGCEGCGGIMEAMDIEKEEYEIVKKEYIPEEEDDDLPF